MQSEEFYQQLRASCVSEEIAKIYPQWPYPLLFQDIEIPRDIFILDQAIDRNAIDLGDNRIHDLTSEQRPELGYWFHYEFFNLWGAAQCSADAIPLHARLCGLKRGLLNASADSKFADFLSSELLVQKPAPVIESFIDHTTRMIEVCRAHDVIVWGIKTRDEDVGKQRDYLNNVLQIPIKHIFELPHMRSALHKWQRVLKEEDKEMRKAEAAFNKLLKTAKRAVKS